MVDPQGTERLPWLEAIAAAALRQHTATTLREVLEAEHAIKRLVLGDSEALEAESRFVREFRSTWPADRGAAPAAPPPAPSRRVAQASLF